MAKKKVKKQSWLKKQLSQVRLLPWYWKSIFSILIFVVGVATGMEVFILPSSFAMIGGFAIFAVTLWLLLNFWLPADKEDNTNN